MGCVVEQVLKMLCFADVISTSSMHSLRSSQRLLIYYYGTTISPWKRLRNSPGNDISKTQHFENLFNHTAHFFFLLLFSLYTFGHTSECSIGNICQEMMPCAGLASSSLQTDENSIHSLLTLPFPDHSGIQNRLVVLSGMKSTAL